MSGKNKNNENIQVYVRCRPINSRERAIHSNEVIKVLSDREVVVKQQLDNRISKKFTFDRAFGPESKQADVYQVVVAPLINQVLTGYNCTVFAYGQTVTGKTHTMIGDETPQNTSSYEDLSAMGIIPRAVSHMFEELRTMGVEFTMRISYLELYNEELCDLLSSNDVTQIRIFEDPNKKGSIIVQGLEEIPVHSTSDVYKLLAKGQEKRRMATTLMSAQSSRSHTVFSVLVHIKEKDGIEGEELLKVGKLNLVDLAGSENISKAGNEKGIRTRETVNINQSLLTLGRVITALVERTPHIPYRESKLTRLLQESLGGRTKTSIIATISPGHKDLEETTSTLEYANRAKNIQNKPEVNQKLTKQTVMKEYTEEIDRLKRDLMAARDKNGFFIAEETYNQMIYQLESQKTELTDQINKLKAEKEKVNQQQQKLAEINTELIARTEELEESENKLLRTNDNLERAKRGYLEKKQIILKQEQTEKTLTSQAKQLLDVANTVTTDVKKLHETISRRKNFDINNREACKNLDSNLNSHFSAMSSNINEYNSALCDQTTSLFKKLNSNTQQNKNICVAILAKINTLIDAEQQAKRDISECIAGGKSGLENIFQKYTEEQNRIMKDVAEQKKQLKQQLDHLQTDYDQTYEQLQQKHSHFQTLQKEHTNFVNDHQSRVRQNLLTQSGTFVSAFESNYETLTSTTKQHEELSCKLSTMFDEIKNLMDKSRAKNQTIKEATNDMKNATNRFKTGFKKDINTACDEFKTKVTENGEKINGVMVDCEAAARNLKSNTTEMMRVSSNNDEQLMANINEMNKKFEEQKNILGDKLYEMLDKVDNTSEMTRINIEGGLQSIVDDATAEQENLDTQHFELEDTINTLDATHKEFHESVKSDIDSCTKRLQTFRNDEVQVYTPTSQTPSKREYNYPKVLTKTSPKAKIVADFWSTHNSNDLDCSVIIAEDPTEDTVLANSSNATNSLLYTSALESDRTLCESRIFNVNSMSTPIVNLPKPNTVQNESNIEPIASVSEEHKEN